MGSLGATNFGHLKAHDEQLVRLGLLAERYFAEDPNTSLLKLRQLAELLAQLVASNVGLFTSPDEGQADLLRRLQDQGIIPREVGNLFHEVRRAGNDGDVELSLLSQSDLDAAKPLILMAYEGRASAAAAANADALPSSGE